MNCEKWTIATFALLVTAGLAGCQQVNPQLAEGIRKGERQYVRGNYVAAERVLSGALEHDPNSAAAAEAYYIRGLTRLKRSQMRLAEQDLTVALDLAGREDLRTNCRVCLGSISYERGQWWRAYDQYRHVADKLADVGPNDWVLYRLGDAAQKIGKWDEAKKYLARVIREFPKSQAAASAQRRLKYDYFTIQAGVFSKRAGANSRVVLLQNAKLPARKETRYSGNGNLQAVCVGKYETFISASRTLTRVKKLVPDARIVP